MIAPMRIKLISVAIMAICEFACLGPNTFTVPKTQKKIGNLGFLIDIPIPGVPIECQFPGNGIVNYDFYLNSREFKPAKLFSVEWISRKGKQPLSEKEVDTYLVDFIPKYLTHNFENGNYTLLFSSPVVLNNEFAGTLFVGSGHHNGGQPGSIYLITVYFDHHWAMIYSLNTNTIEKDNPSLRSMESVAGLPAFGNFSKFADSFDLDLPYKPRK
ncbi:hypothetical protein [Geothrix paludis]|uniref:hypothetical protein n=1 Tax=Geothrix paludis TaxID=2922722 RepID=UPI001FABE662|nr:hypothetical protein [Geothrix paludis]